MEPDNPTPEQEEERELSERWHRVKASALERLLRRVVREELRRLFPSRSAWERDPDRPGFLIRVEESADV